MENISQQERSRIMARVRSKNTKPELIVRRLAHSLGYRFRLHRKDLPGSPDIVFPSRRVAVFVHGCFWHGHTCQHGQKRPATNVEYWEAKLARNTNRDAKAQAELTALGWTVLVIWECQIKSADLSKILVDTLSSRVNG